MTSKISKKTNRARWTTCKAGGASQHNGDKTKVEANAHYAAFASTFALCASAMTAKADSLQPSNYMYPSHRRMSFMLATTMRRMRMPKPTYSALMRKFSLGLRRVTIS